MARPRSIGRYTLLRKLAAGGMAEVFLARQTGLRGMVRQVALKRVLPELMERGEIVETFLEEVRLSANLNHPNVVAVQDAGEDGGVYYLVMEYVEGSDLRRLLDTARRRGESLPLSFVLRVAADAARGLHHAHTLRPRGLIHRDVSPSNLLVGTSGVTKVADFGIACLLDAGGQAAGLLPLGKLLYRSPEQCRGESLTPASDLFALAAVVWEMCTGTPLFLRERREAVTEAILGVDLPPVGAEASIPEGLETLLRQALDPRPERRPESCAVFAEALDALASAHGTASPEEVGGIVRRFGVEKGGEDPPIRDARTAPVVDVWTGDETAQSAAATEIEVPEDSMPLHHRLPRYAGGFIGRNHELDRLERAFCEGGAWVTLVGPGGVGKTRLAVRHAELQAHAYRPPGAGVWFCDLGEAREATAFCGQVAQALDQAILADTLEAWVERLGEALQRLGRALLILDNLEQIAAEVGPILERWCEAAEDLHLLVTSRRPLHGRQETVIEVPPLPLDREEPERSEAFRLFLARAERARPGLALSTGERLTVGRIVEALDGLPLAIELAAARMALLSPEQILERLSERFTLLRSGPAEGASKAQALEATIAWSWDLLEPDEQDALVQCTVFRGGFTLEAAEAVVVLSGPDAPSVIDVISTLKDHALLRASSVEPGQAPRLALYQSVADFVSARGDAQVIAAARQRHAATYQRLAAERTPDAEGEAGPRVLAELRADLDNLLAAEATLSETDPAASARILLSLFPVFHGSVPIERWLEIMDRALEAARRAKVPALRARAHLERARVLFLAGRLTDTIEEAFVAREVARRAKDTTIEGRALCLAGFVACEQGDFRRARQRLEEAIAILELVDAPAELALAYNRLGVVEAKEGGPDRARSHWERALSLFERAGHPAGRLKALQNLALILQDEDPNAALSYYERAIALHQRLGDRREEAAALNNVGTVYVDLEDYDRAREIYERALRIFARHARLPSETICRANLLILEHLAGRFSAARRHGEQALRLARQLGDRWLEGITLAHLAALEARQGTVRRAAEAFAEARARLDETGTTYFRDAFEVLTGLLDLARARKAVTRGAGAEANVHLEAARAKLRAATEPDASGRVPVEHEVDLRLAARLLATALAQTENG